MRGVDTVGSGDAALRLSLKYGSDATWIKRSGDPPGKRSQKLLMEVRGFHVRLATLSLAALASLPRRYRKIPVSDLAFYIVPMDLMD